MPRVERLGGDRPTVIVEQTIVVSPVGRFRAALKIPVRKVGRRVPATATSHERRSRFDKLKAQSLSRRDASLHLNLRAAHKVAQRSDIGLRRLP